MTDAALESTATWFLFYLARARTTNIAHKRCTKDAGDSVLCDDATELVRCYSKQRQIEQTKFPGQTALLNGNSCQNGRTREIKAEQRRVFREQLFFALL